MHNVVHAETYIPNNKNLENLIYLYESCKRFAYNRFHKENLSTSKVREAAKAKYCVEQELGILNIRQMRDAVLEAQGLKEKHKDNKIIFGGRDNWNLYNKKEITKEQWLARKNKQYFSRGRNHNGDYGES